MFISLQVLWIFEILVGFGKNTQMVVEPFIHFEFDSTLGQVSHTISVPRSFVLELIEAHEPQICAQFLPS